MTHTNETEKKSLMAYFKSKAKKNEELVVDTSTEISIAVPDIKQYLVDEYERTRVLQLTNESLEQQLEEAKAIKLKYDAALVTLDEYSRRIKSSEFSITREKEKNANMQQELSKMRDELNSYKIQMTRAAITKEDMRDEIVEAYKQELIDKINKHKGNLSKKIVCDLIADGMFVYDVNTPECESEMAGVERG